MHSCTPAGSSSSAPDNLRPSKQQKVEDAPKADWSGWFAEFVRTDGDLFSKRYKSAITDLPFYKYYSSVVMDSRVEDIVKKNINMLGRIKDGLRLSCSNDGTIQLGESSTARMLRQDPADKIQNLRIFSIFLTKCPDNILCNPNRLDDFPRRISKAIEGLSHLRASYAKEVKKQHKLDHLDEVIGEFTRLLGKVRQPDRAPLNLDATVEGFVFQMEGIAKDSSLKEEDKFMKAYSTLSHYIPVLFTRDSFPTIYKVDFISSEIFPRWPRWAFITWVILQSAVASPMKNLSEPGRQYTNFLRVMRACEVQCEGFIEQREPFASQPKATTTILDRDLFEQFFKDFLPLMEKVEKKALEQTTPENMTVKIGFALFQLAGGLAGMSWGRTPFEVMGNYALGKSFETLAAELSKSDYIKDGELVNAKTALEKLTKESANPAEAMTKFKKAFTAEMEKYKEAHDSYEAMKKLIAGKEEGKE